MKILQIIPLLVPGGAERFVIELSNELVSKGYDCSILTFYLFKDKVNLKANNSVKHDIILKKPGFDFSLMFKVVNYIKKNKYDIVHVHVSAIKYILLASFLLPKVKFIATIHSEASREAGKTLDRWARQLMFRFNLCTPVTISEESLCSFEKFYGRTAPMVYNGVANPNAKDINLRDDEGQLVFIHPASCQDVKNQKLLFRAFNRVVNDFPNIKLIWIGENKTNSQYFEEVKQLLNTNIEYHGTVTNVRDYLYSADAMCLSSKMEGMPMTIIEAFSVGCIPLCTPVGGCVNMIQNGTNGFLAKDLSEDAYYSMLINFCKLSYKDRARVKEQAIQSFDRYSINKCMKGYLNIYND